MPPSPDQQPAPALSGLSSFTPLHASLRLKLTLWTVTIFVIIQASLGLVFQLYQSESINSFFNERLRARAQRFATLIRDDPAAVTDEQLLKLSSERTSFALPDTVEAYVFEESGELVATSTDRSEPVLNELVQLVRSAAEGRTAGREFFSIPGPWVDDELHEQRAARGILFSMFDKSGQRYVLAMIVSDVYALDMLALLSRVTLITIPIGILASGIASYLIAGVAVRPINALTMAVRRISPESIGQHVDVPVASAELVALRNELELARARIEAGFQALERFMSNVSHEIKTPIAVILAEAQTVKLEDTAPQVREFVHSVSEEAQRLGRTVDSFLLLTRVRHGKTEVPRSQLCLIRDSLMDSFESCSHMAAQMGVRLDVILPEGDHIDAAVVGNCDLLKTVFDNLVRNALRFSPPGSLVTLSAEVHEDKVHATVRDQGPGIPTELLPRIFDRFSQSKDEERRGRGHGLGLEIAMGIIELHGGTITVRNRDDGGAEFTVILPLLAADKLECACDAA